MDSQLDIKVTVDDTIMYAQPPPEGVATAEFLPTGGASRKRSMPMPPSPTPPSFLFPKPNAMMITAALNNAALDLLEAGRNDEAIQLLESALAKHQEMAYASGFMERQQQAQGQAAASLASFSSFPTSPPCIPQSDSMLSDDLDDDEYTMQGLDTELSPVIRTRNTDNPQSDSADLPLSESFLNATSPSNFFTVYNRVVEITHLTLSHHQAHVPAILLYNRGLAWHRLALAENSDAKYEKALESYHTAHSQLIYHASLGLYYAPVCDLLLLALCNNCGHIHSHFFRLEETRLCVEALFTVFFVIGNKRILTKAEYVFFYMNILLTVNRMPVLAPAA